MKDKTISENASIELMERIASALEMICEKLTGIEGKIEDLTYEIQSHGSAMNECLEVVAQAYEQDGFGCGESGQDLPFSVEGQTEGGCGGGGCGSGGCHN